MGHSERYLVDARKQNTNIKPVDLAILAEELDTTPEYLTGLTDDPGKKNTAVPQDDGNYIRIDYQAGRIRSAHPVAILAAQYSVPSAVMQNIAGCDLTHAHALCIGLDDPTPEELEKIAQVFRVSLDDLSQGWVSLLANQGVHEDITLRKSYRFPERERSE